MMDSKTRLTQNSLWMIVSRFGAQGLAVIFTILLARRLGSIGFGEYAFIATMIFVANALTTFGTDMLLIREIAAKGDLAHLPFALVVQLVLSGLFVAAVWMFGTRIPNQGVETITALQIYSLSLIPLAFFTVFTSALRGKQLMGTYALLNIVGSALQVGAVLILRDRNLVVLSSFLLAVQILAALFAGLFCSFVIPHFWLAFQPASLPFSSFLKEAAPIAWLALLGMLYQRLNIYLLSTMSGPVETGIYSAAFRVVEASKTAHLAVFAALYPAMAQNLSLRGVAPSAPRRHLHSGPVQVSNLHADEELAAPGFDAPVLALLAAKYPKLLIAGAVFISLLLFIAAKPLVSLLYGNEFSASSRVLQILAWMLIPFAVNTYLTLSFLAWKGERLVGRALMASLLGLLILNLWWIPIRGPEGSAWAALAAECFQSVILLVSARSIVPVQGEVRELSELS